MGFVNLDYTPLQHTQTMYEADLTDADLIRGCDVMFRVSELMGVCSHHISHQVNNSGQT